jgi:arylsulfatase A-like enzyme
MQLEMVNIYDVVPTLLAAWGLPIPEGVDGEVIHPAFTNELEVIQAPDHSGDERFVVNTNIDYSEEILDRLRSLGYME